MTNWSLCSLARFREGHSLTYTNTPVGKLFCLFAHFAQFVRPGYRCRRSYWEIVVWFPAGGRRRRFLSSPRHQDRSWSPLSLQFVWYRGVLSSGARRSGPEADHSPNLRQRKRMTPTATLPYAIMAHTGSTLHSLTQTEQIWAGKMVREVFSYCVYHVPVPESTG